MKDRETKLTGSTYAIKTGCGFIYVTINCKDDSPFELFANIGKAGGCASSQSEALGRMVSTCLRGGVPMEDIRKQLGDIRCHLPIMDGDKVVVGSCSDAIARAMEMADTCTSSTVERWLPGDVSSSPNIPGPFGYKHLEACIDQQEGEDKPTCICEDLMEDVEDS